MRAPNQAKTIVIENWCVCPSMYIHVYTVNVNRLREKDTTQTGKYVRGGDGQYRV
jgi:adenylate cyclase